MVRLEESTLAKGSERGRQGGVKGRPGVKVRQMGTGRWEGGVMERQGGRERVEGLYGAGKQGQSEVVAARSAAVWCSLLCATCPRGHSRAACHKAWERLLELRQADLKRPSA